MQRHILTFRGGNHAASAHEDARERALGAAEDRAENRADAGAGADFSRLAFDTFAFERLLDGRTYWIGSSVDPDLIERDREAAFAFDVTGLLNRADHAAHD